MEKVNQAEEYRKYLTRHPGRTIMIGKLPGQIKVRMEDGQEIIVPPFELLPE
jgi:hypothetical protein